MQTSKNTTLLKRTYINGVVTLLNYLLDSLIVFVTTNFFFIQINTTGKKTSFTTFNQTHEDKYAMLH